ncbi:MAG: hypothetical protein IRZ16_14745 [Myxococcaceae bacterium]|nr:hypothetical protein [Myxococcaceae bacterium]
MKYRYRKLTSSFDEDAYSEMIAVAKASQRGRLRRLRKRGFHGVGPASGDSVMVAGLVSAPRKVHVSEGEADEVDIRGLIRSGELGARDLVSADGAMWSTLGEHPAFLDLFDEDEVYGHTFPWAPLLIIGAVLLSVAILTLI